ncbi:MAG: hypothetical protein JKX78_03685 [Alteromonadaceae bacterium]|nr:hypothetical protein [Alteromonadaceae bacterium]MBL4909120.1 hypothetical protein [Alteromonadaceae bacterium]
MQLSTHALSTPATDAHTFYILNLYTGAKYSCSLRSETKWYYIVEVTGMLSRGAVAVRRFHKATMCIDELCLYIRNVKEETAARIEAVKADRAATDEQELLNVLAPTSGYCLNCECHSNGLTFSADWDMLICPECASDKADYEANPPKALDTPAVNTPEVLEQCSQIIDRVLTAPLLDGNHRRVALNELDPAQWLQCSPAVKAAVNAAAQHSTPTTHTDPGGPISHDAPHFCPACESYVKADEMTASAWVTMLICIDCANDEEEALTATKTVIVHNQHDGSTYDAEILKATAQGYTVLIHAGVFGDLVRPFPFDTLHNAHLALEVRGDVDTVCHVIDVETNNQFRAVLFSETTRFYTVDVFGWDGVPTRHHFSKIRMLSRDFKLAISRG